jgi:hypothetical protein
MAPCRTTVPTLLHRHLGQMFVALRYTLSWTARSKNYIAGNHPEQIAANHVVPWDDE